MKKAGKTGSLIEVGQGRKRIHEEGGETERQQSPHPVPQSDTSLSVSSCLALTVGVCSQATIKRSQ